MYIYAYPAPRSSASNRLVIRSDRYDERSGNPSNCTLRSDGTVWRGKNAESETRHPRGSGTPRASVASDDRPVVPTRVHTAYAAPRRPAPGTRRQGPRRQRGGQRMTRRGSRAERTGHTVPVPPATPHPLSPRGSPIPRSRRVNDNTIGCDERNDRTQCTPRTREERARGCSSTRPAGSR